MAQRVDFNKLDTVALKRYRRFHKLDDVGPNPTKEELVSAVAKHFTVQVAIVLCGRTQCRVCIHVPHSTCDSVQQRSAIAVGRSGSTIVSLKLGL